MNESKVEELKYKGCSIKLTDGRTRRTFTLSEFAIKKLIDLCEKENISQNAMIEKAVNNYKDNIKIKYNKCAIKFGEDGGI